MALNAKGLVDANDPAWMALRAHIEARIAQHLTVLERERDQIAAAELRGMIAALREVIRAAEPPASSAPEMQGTGRVTY